MTTILTIQKNLQRLSNRNALEEIAIDAVKRTRKIAEALQRNQLKDGFDNEGKTIGTYARATELRYLFDDSYNPRSPKVEGEHYNFDDTGGFIDGITTIFETQQVSFWSNDSKTELLVSKYDDLLGLDPKNLRNYALNTLLPIIQKTFLDNLIK